MLLGDELMMVAGCVDDSTLIADDISISLCCIMCSRSIQGSASLSYSTTRFVLLILGFLSSAGFEHSLVDQMSLALLHLQLPHHVL